MAKKDIPVDLTAMEMYQAGLVGLARRIDSMRRNLSNTTGVVNSWNIDIEGALGEMALAKALNMYAGLPINNYKEADIGPYHVRTTEYDDGCLILRKEDKLDCRYVLITGKNGKYMVRGQIEGYAGTNPAYWRDPNGRPGAYFVPQSALQGL